MSRKQQPINIKTIHYNYVGESTDSINKIRELIAISMVEFLKNEKDVNTP